MLFYSTKEISASSDQSIPDANLTGQLSGKTSGFPGRIKDFEILDLTSCDAWRGTHLLITSSSDGTIRVWAVNATSSAKEGISSRLLDSYETGNRITCMVAFVMQEPQDMEAIRDSDLDSDDQEEGDESAEESSESDQE